MGYPARGQPLTLPTFPFETPRSHINHSLLFRWQHRESSLNLCKSSDLSYHSQLTTTLTNHTSQLRPSNIPKPSQNGLYVAPHPGTNKKQVGKSHPQ